VEGKKGTEVQKMNMYCIAKFLLEYAIKKVKEDNELLVLNGTLHFLVYVDVILLGGNTSIKKKQKLYLMLVWKKTQRKQIIYSCFVTRIQDKIIT
jgi:hypothetical protein